MAEEINTKKPNVGIRGNTQDLPQLKKNEHLVASTSLSNFASAATELATTPDSLSTLSTQIASSSAQTLAQKWGYESGLNPSGNPFPAITKFDKTFNDSYISQSQNTLSLEANRLIIEGQNELQKSERLTPNLIKTYEASMQSGLSSIYKMAPDEVKGALQLHYETSLMHSTNALNNKMLSQQRAETKDKANAANLVSQQSIFEASMVGNFDVAKALSESSIESIRRQEAGNILSHTEAQTQINAIKKTIITSQKTYELNQKRLEKEAHEKKIQGVVNAHTEIGLKLRHNKDYDEVRALTAENLVKRFGVQDAFEMLAQINKNLNVLDAADKAKESALYSEGKRLIAENTMTPGFLQELERGSYDKARYNNFVADFEINQNKKNAKQNAAQALIPNWSDSNTMALASNDAKNNAFHLKAQHQIQYSANRGQSLDEREAEVIVMTDAATPIPDFTDTMNAGLLSGNSSLMLDKLHAYNSLDRNNPKVLTGISPQAIAMKTQFEMQLQGNEPDVAAQNARRIVLQKTKQQEENNTEQYKDWKKKYASTVSQQISWANDIANVPRSAKIINSSGFAKQALDVYESYFNLHDGDIVAATKDTKAAMTRSWGVTNAFGQSQFVFQPLEKTTETDSGAVPLFNEDIHSQLRAQIAEMNEIYHNGVANKDKRLSFYYRLGERPTFEQFVHANEMVNNPGVEKLDFLHPNEDYYKALETIKRYKEEPVTIERVNDSGRIEKFVVEAKADPALQIDPNSGVIGFYNITLRDESGHNTPMNGWFNGSLSDPIYKPNKNQIRERYATINRLAPQGLTPEEWEAQSDLYDFWLKNQINLPVRGLG